MPNGASKLYAQTVVRTTQKCAKEYYLDEQGILHSRASAQLSTGIVFVVVSDDPDEIAQASFSSPPEYICIGGFPFELAGNHPHLRGVAIPANLFLAHQHNWSQLLWELNQIASPSAPLLELVADKDYDPTNKKQIARTGECFAYLERFSALMLIDCDVPKPEYLYPNQQIQMPQSAGELVEWVKELDEQIAGAPMFCLPSSSSYIYDKNGALLKNKPSYHLMICVQNSTDIPQLTEYLFCKAYAKSGFVITSSSGSQYARTFVDAIVGKASRLDFACKSIFNDDLKRIVPTHEQIWKPTGARLQIENLEQKLSGARRKKETKFYIDKTTPEAKQYRDERKANHRGVGINKLIAKEPTLTREQAEKRYEEHQVLLKEKTLPPDFILHFSETETISAGEIFIRYEEFRGKGICSPSEPDYEGYKHCAQVLTRSGKKAIGDHHLGIVYELQEPIDAGFDDSDEDEDSYTSDITNQPYRDCIIAFIAHHRAQDLFELEQDQSEASGQHMRASFNDVIWYFKRDKMHITALNKQTIPKQTQTKFSKTWRVMYDLYEAQVVSHQDSVLARISAVDNNPPTAQISDLLTQTNPPRRMSLIGGTGSGKSYGVVKHLCVPLAIKRAQQIAEGKPLTGMERPVVFVPSKANIATYCIYFWKEVEAYQQAHGKLSDEVLAVLKDPTRVVRYTRDERRALGVKNNAEILEILQASCIVFTTYAYLQRRSFLNYCYIVAKLIAEGGCLVVADEIHALHTASQKTYFQDTNFYDCTTKDDDPAGSFSMDFSNPASGDATTDDENDDEGGAEVDEDEGARYRVSCAQSAHLRQHKTADPEICQRCEYKEDGWWITAKEREMDNGEMVSRLLPQVMNKPIHPTDLGIARNSPLRYEFNSELHHPRQDSYLISKVQYEAPFKVNGVRNATTISPMHISDIINRKLPTKKDPKVNYQEEFAKTVAGGMHLQLVKVYPTYTTRDDNGVETIHRLTREDAQKYIPEASYFPRIGCGLASIKFFDPFAFQVLGLANRLVLMSATVSDEVREDINTLLPNVDWQHCQGQSQNMGTAQLVLFHERLGLDEQLETLDRWVQDDPKGREMLVVRSRKSVIYKSAREHEKYHTVANYLNEQGKQIGHKSTSEYRLHHTYMRHPMMTGQNLPIPVSIFEIDHFQPFYATYIQSSNPIWQDYAKPEADRLSPEELWSEIELAIKREWLSLLLQALGRPMRLDEGNPQDEGHRLYILVNSPFVYSSSGQKYLLTLDDISPKILKAFNERFKQVLEVYAPANQRNRKHLMPLLKDWVGEPTKLLEIALTGRNARKRRLSPMEKKRERLLVLKAEGKDWREIYRALNLQRATEEVRGELKALFDAN